MESLSLQEKSNDFVNFPFIFRVLNRLKTFSSAFGSAHLWHPIVSTGALRSERIWRRLSNVFSQSFGTHLVCFGSTFKSTVCFEPSESAVFSLISIDLRFSTSFVAAISFDSGLVFSDSFFTSTGFSFCSVFDSVSTESSFSVLILMCLRWLRVCRGEKYGDVFSDGPYTEEK